MLLPSEKDEDEVTYSLFNLSLGIETALGQKQLLTLTNRTQVNALVDNRNATCLLHGVNCLENCEGKARNNSHFGCGSVKQVTELQSLKYTYLHVILRDFYEKISTLNCWTIQDSIKEIGSIL